MPEPLPAPWPEAPGRLVAPAGWRAIDILSDLHLHAATPRTAQALAAHLATTDADAVLLLGDVFEAWVGDDGRLEGFEAQLTAQLREAAARRWIGFMAGNRDFLVGPAWLADTGVQRLQDPTVLEAFGQRLLLTHGDALCTADTDYQRFRAQVRQPAWQAAFLAQPLSARRETARRMRDASEQRRRQSPPGEAGTGSEAYGDIDQPLAARWLAAAGAQTLVHGHTHHPLHEPLGPGLSRWVTSDWDFDSAPGRGDVLRLDASGLQRRPALGP